MQKTKLGVSVGLLGAVIYFTSILGGFFATIFLVGYVLLFEENVWLKKSAVKAVTLLTVFSLVTMIINLVPDLIIVLNNIATVFGGKFGITILTRIATSLVSGIDLGKKILFIGLGIKALNQGMVAIPIVDKLIEKYFE